jgi:hypothetical protein
MRSKLLFPLLLLSCNNDKGVIIYNMDPATALLEPMDGDVFDEGEPILFSGTVNDDSDLEYLDVQLLSSLDGEFLDVAPPDPNGYIEYTSASLTEGVHTITLRAIDEDGAQGDSSLTIEVLDVPDIPSIEVIHPAGGEVGLEGFPFVFMAYAEDRQDPPEDLLIEMSATPGGFICYMVIDGGGNSQCAATMPIGYYVLTFTVTDAEENSAQAMGTYQVVSMDDYDADGDGYSPNGGDCNDSNNTIYPGAPEICDGMDNDCNELTGVDVGSECYDDDLDGFCETPPCINTANTESDCDDGLVDVSPLAEEIVNGIDDDCDGLIDEGTNVYDDDGDGFCESPPCVNTPNLESDCNDDEYLVYPTATETCGDGIDNNCNGLANEQNAIGCTNFYYDSDGDTYGVSGSTECWCEGGSFPYTGIDNTDCYDSNASAHPLQTSYFNAHRGDGSFDYDCSGGSEEKQYYGVSNGCSNGFLGGFQCEVNGLGWENYEPSCGQSGVWVDDCDTSIPALCFIICAVGGDLSCWLNCGATCEPDSTSMAQGCR